MNSTLFISLFGALGIIYFIIGIIASKRVKNTTDYFLAGRNLGLLSVASTLIATQLGGALLLGTAQWSYNYGMYGILYAIGMSLGFILLACGFASKLQSCNVATTAQLFETKYNAPLLKKFASLISIVSLWGILIMLVVASKSLISGLGISGESVFISFWLFTIVYTVIGGLKAVVLTDKIQLVFIIASLGGVFLYALFSQPNGILSLTELFQHQSSFSLAGLSGGKMLATFLVPALFALVEQDLAQCFFAARSQRVALYAALVAGLFIIGFGLIPVYFGMQAHALDIAIPIDGNPFIAILKHITNDLTFSLVICGIVAAIVSTADTLLCAISSNIAQDFNLNFGNARRKLHASQGITFFVGLIAVVASYTVDKNIINIAVSSYELSVSCMLIPILAAFYTKNPKREAAIGAALFGLIGFIVFRFYPVGMPKEIATLLLSGLGYVAGYSINK